MIPRTPHPHRRALLIGALFCVAIIGACQTKPPSAASSDFLGSDFLGSDFLGAEVNTMLDSAKPEIERGACLSGRVYPPDSPPAISVEQPDLTKSVHSPFGIRIRFTAADAPIDPKTFRIRYQWALGKIDITDEASKYLTVTDAGATADNIPIDKPGCHKLLLEVKDTKQRVAQTELKIEVVR